MINDSLIDINRLRTMVRHKLALWNFNELDGRKAESDIIGMVKACARHPSAPDAGPQTFDVEAYRQALNAQIRADNGKTAAWRYGIMRAIRLLSYHADKTPKLVKLAPQVQACDAPVQVCPICDIAGCKHIRAKAKQPVDVCDYAIDLHRWTKAMSAGDTISQQVFSLVDKVERRVNEQCGGDSDVRDIVRFTLDAIAALPANASEIRLTQSPLEFLRGRFKEQYIGWNYGYKDILEALDGAGYLRQPPATSAASKETL